MFNLTSDSTMIVPLTELKDREQGVIAAVQSVQSTRQRGPHRHGRQRRFERRLMDMGLTPGTPITVVKSAPFNGPIEILIRGSRLALGRQMAYRIIVNVNRE